MIMYKIHSVDNGFCRVNYVFKNIQEKNVYYCLAQKNHIDVGFFRSSQDLEPSYELHFYTSVFGSRELFFEMPTGNTELEKKVCEWIKK